jgi:hypothetical protein
MNGEGNNTAGYTALDLIAGMKNGEPGLTKERSFTCPSHGEYKGKVITFREHSREPPCPFCREEREKEETARNTGTPRLKTSTPTRRNSRIVLRQSDTSSRTLRSIWL